MLDALHLERRRGRTDLIFDFQALEHTAPPELVERQGRPWEHIRGQYVPRRWRFIEAKYLQGENVEASLEGLSLEHPDRLIYSALAWRKLDGRGTYMINLFRQKEDTLFLAAEGCVQEDRNGPVLLKEFERDWSPPPLSAARRLIPAPRRLWQRFGGDPITIHINGRKQPLRLFVGGLDTQPKQRPQVGVSVKSKRIAQLMVHGCGFRTSFGPVGRKKGKVPTDMRPRTLPERPAG